MKPWRTEGVTPRRAAAATLALLTLAVAGGRPDPGFAESHAAGPGFLRTKLERVSEFFRNEIATGKIPGAILLIQQHGHPVYFENFGVRDPGRAADDGRYDLSIVFDVEADHIGGSDDAGR